MLKKKQRMHAAYLLALLGALVAGAVLLGCFPTPTPGALQFNVQRQAAVVRTGAAAPLSPLTDNAFHSLPDGHLVRTDASGEALLQSTFEGTTCRIYLFFNGGLRKAGCPGSTFAGSSTTCLEERSAVYRGCSRHVIMTPSGEAQVVGSWVWVTYLPDRQLTLVAVLEGKVLFRPVLEFDSREMGDAIPVGAQEFLYTAPDAMLEELAGLPTRTALPLDQLPPLIDVLGLDPWAERARDRADQDDVLFPEPREELFLQGGGGALENEAVQQAVLRAVPWTELTEELFPSQDAPVAAALPGVESVDARTVEQNPDMARQLLARAGFPNGFGLVLLYAPDDGQIAAMADVIVESLREVGIQVKSGAVPAAEAPDVMREIVLGGDAALWLGREFLEVDLSAPPVETRDETPPSISRPDVSPAEPTPDDQVTISVAARDAESGVERIEIYVNQKLVQRCTSAKCSVTLGAFSGAGDVQVQVLAYDQAGNQSSQEGSFAVVESARSGLILRSGGGPFKDSRVQTAVLHAAPWAEMVSEVFGDPNLPVLTELDGQEIDARKMEHNPDLALEMLAEAGYPNGFGVTLLVPQGDEHLAAMGDWLASILGEVGIDAGFTEVPADAARDTMAKYVAAGEAVLWLSRQ